jgi:hypothetical protein
LFGAVNIPFDHFIELLVEERHKNESTRPCAETWLQNVYQRNNGTNVT